MRRLRGHDTVLTCFYAHQLYARVNVPRLTDDNLMFFSGLALVRFVTGVLVVCFVSNALARLFEDTDLDIASTVLTHLKRITTPYNAYANF